MNFNPIGNKLWTDAEHAMHRVVQALAAAGWEYAGHTRAATVRVPTRRSPLLGKGGGELRRFGGRTRYTRGGRVVTVGKRTVYFYGAGEAKHFDTKDFEAIRQEAK